MDRRETGSRATGRQTERGGAQRGGAAPRSRTPEAGAAKAQQATYTCSMHPEVKQSTPGNCPKCDMELTRK